MDKKITIIFIWLAFFFGCKTSNEVTYTNLATSYNPDAKLKIDGIRVFHENDSTSRVYLSYNTDALMYVQPPGKEYFRSDYSFTYQLFDNYESNKVLDEQTFTLSDSLFYKNPAVLHLDFGVKAYFPGTYLLEIHFMDLNADRSVLYPMNIEKDDKNNAGYFLPLDEDGNVIFTDWISWKDKFIIKCSDADVSRLYVGRYDRDFPTAAPPFSQARSKVYDYDPDETFTVKVTDGVSEPMQFVDEGFYHFRSDDASRNGLTLFRFGDYYPEIRKPEQMVPPLRYLTTGNEFMKLVNAAQPKQAVDSFWIKMAGSEGRAGELIEKYYRRVEDANRYFTSHKEGWKTDRGMIYIIFGKPRTVYRRTGIETWVYGEQGNRVYQTFDFLRVVNPFSDNDYELRRNPDYKAQWYNAILFWRQ